MVYEVACQNWTRGSSASGAGAAFGILVGENFVVCEVEANNERMVRLEVAERGC